MFENIMNFFKKIGKKDKLQECSKDTAKERLHLVLMQDRANVSADFLDMMKQEIIEVIKKYIDVDEKDIDVRLTNKTNEDGTTGAPALYANIPIAGIKEEIKKEKSKEETEVKSEPKNKTKKNEKQKSKDKKAEPIENKEEQEIEEDEIAENIEDKEAKEDTNTDENLQENLESINEDDSINDVPENMEDIPTESDKKEE
ncbi:MAG: cell division topological specificity factor MinE [Clostridia bacterium]